MQNLMPIYVGIGSNCEREAMLLAAYQCLKNYFTDICLSPVYRSKAVGFVGNDFYNAVIGFSTNKSLPKVNKILQQIQFDLDPVARTHSDEYCKIDLDLLLYGDITVTTAEYVLPRSDIMKYAFVLKPLADIAPASKHPQLAKTYKTLWDELFFAKATSLQLVDFNWELYRRSTT